MEYFQPPEGGSETRVWTTRSRLMRRRTVERTLKNGLKAFVGREHRQPLTKIEKAELRVYVRKLMKGRRKGAVYGVLTAKQVEVYLILLDGFHNCRSGRCDPSYAQIEARADCCNRTIAKALYALEQAGLLYRIRRVEKRVLSPSKGLGDIVEPLVQQASNAYVFTPPGRLRPPELLINQRDHIDYDRPQPRNLASKAKAERVRAVADEVVEASLIDDATLWRETISEKNIPSLSIANCCHLSPEALSKIPKPVPRSV